MITRKQYMADSANLHESYYGQFVTPEIKQRVLKRFGIEILKNEFQKDENLNGIPLKCWDDLAGNRITFDGYAATLCADTLKAAGDGPTWSNSVCILKAAARQIVNENQ